MTRLKLAQASEPPNLALPKWWAVPIIVAVLAAAMALAQLASFETFAMIIGSYGLVQGQGMVVFALVIAGLEILSLPVLLRLRLSRAMRAVSAVAVILAPLVWLQLAVWTLIYGLPLINTGYFGDFLPHPSGWWTVVESVVYLAVSMFALRILGGDKLLSK